MNTIKIRSSYGAMLSSRAAKICLLTVVILLPIVWSLLTARNSASSELIRTLFVVGALAPGLGIVVALFSLLSVIRRGRKTVLTLGSEVAIPSTGISFNLQQLGLIQLFSHRGHNFIALLPAHLQDRLQPTSIISGEHNLAPYIVEFPQGANLKTFEVADRLQESVPGVEVEKIGELARMPRVLR